MEFLVQQLVWGAVLPGTIVVVLLALSWSLWRGEGVAFLGSIPLALAGGYLFAHWRIIGFPLNLPPVDSNEWLFVGAIVLAIWGVVENVASLQSWLRWIGRGIVTLALSWAVLHPIMGNLWQGALGVLWWLLLATLWWLWWSLQAQWHHRLHRTLPPLVLSMVAGGGGFVLLWSNSSSLSQLSGAVAAVAGAMVPLALWKRSYALSEGGVAVLAGMLGMLWINAIVFASMPWWRASVLAVATFSPMLTLLPILRHRPIWVAGVACAVVTALLLGATMLPTYNAYVASASSYGY